LKKKERKRDKTKQKTKQNEGKSENKLQHLTASASVASGQRWPEPATHIGTYRRIANQLAGSTRN